WLGPRPLLFQVISILPEGKIWILCQPVALSFTPTTRFCETTVSVRRLYRMPTGSPPPEGVPTSQYLHPSSDKSSWSGATTEVYPVNVCRRVFVTVLPEIVPSKNWFPWVK